MDRDKHIIELHLPSKLGFERIAMDSAASIARIMDFTGDRVEDLKTAVSEACINAIEHGNKQAETEKVVVRMTFDESSLKVDIHDRGDKFNPVTEKPDIKKKIDGTLPPRGWGMFLVKNLVDELEFSSEAGGNVTTMVIYLHRK